MPSRKVIERSKARPSLVEHTDWRKGHHSLLNLHQVSSALAVQEGLEHAKGPTSIHLTLKRQLRESFVPPENCLTQKELMKTGTNLLLTLNRPRSWSKILQSMRGDKENNKHSSTATSSPIMPSCRLRPPVCDIPAKPKRQEAVQPLHFRTSPNTASIFVFAASCEESPVPERTSMRRGNFMEQLC
jgi:hypothetical protein